MGIAASCCLQIYSILTSLVGFSCSALGTTTVSVPFSVLALMLSVSTAQPSRHASEHKLV